MDQQQKQQQQVKQQPAQQHIQPQTQAQSQQQMQPQAQSVASRKSPGYLYETAEEIGTSGTIADRKRFAEESTDATAAKNAANQWRDLHGQPNPMAKQ